MNDVSSDTGKQWQEGSDVRVSVDWFTVLGTPRDGFHGWVNQNSSVWRAEETSSKQSERWHVPNYGFFNQSNGRHYDGSKITYAFNPSNTSVEAVTEVFRDWMEFERFTRIDVAVDYRRNLKDCFFSVHRLGWDEYRSASGNLKTKNFGTRGKGRSFRIYNKGRTERCGFDWWRIEAEYHPSAGAPPLREDFFERLTAVELIDAKSLSVEELGAVCAAIERRSTIKQMHSKRRTELRRMVEAHTTALSPSPDEVYRAAFPELSRYVDAANGRRIGGLKEVRL